VAKKSRSSALARSERVILALQAAREKQGVSQRSLSAKLGKDPTMVGKIERGDRALSLSDFFLMCSALGLSPSEVVKTSSSD
jgi:transcriptional regulator with XRE-family HTH domain